MSRSTQTHRTAAATAREAICEDSRSQIKWERKTEKKGSGPVIFSASPQTLRERETEIVAAQMVMLFVERLTQPWRSRDHHQSVLFPALGRALGRGRGDVMLPARSGAFFRPSQT